MKYSITEILNPDEFLELYEKSSDLYKASVEKDYYLSYDWYYPLLKGCASSPGKLIVFACWSDKELQGLFPCFLSREKRHLIKVNILGLYGNVYSPRRSAIVSKDSEIIIVETFVNYLTNEFNTEWDLIDFWNLSKKDRITCALKDAFEKQKMLVLFQKQFANIRTFLGDWEEGKFFISLRKKLRQNIRTGINKFRKNGSSIVWLIENDTQDVTSAMHDYYRVYDDSWKEKEADPLFHSNLAGYLAAKNKLRLFILYHREGNGELKEHSNNITSINDGLYMGKKPPGKEYKPVAVNYFVVDDDIAYYLKTAYRKKYRRFSAGTVLFWFSVKHFIESDRCSIIDHQQGKEDYKLKWGDVYETRYKMQAANPFSMIGKLEMWLDSRFLPLCRKIKYFWRK